MFDSAKEVRKGEELNWDNLEDYLRAKLPDMVQGEMKVSQFHGGHANLTYLISFETIELILRRPPFGKIAPGAHDMKREYRVLSKLYKEFPEAPRAYLYSDDESIIGSPFVILERKTGVVVRTELIDCFKPFDRAEKRLTTAMIKTMADLHAVDIDKADLTKLGRPEGYLDRQLKGWAKRWELLNIDGNKEIEEVYKLLSNSIPNPQRVSIVHNDIKLDNCQFQPDNPDNVSAVFDWDMATLGDPLVDIGSTLSYWVEPAFKKYDMPVFLSETFPEKALLIKKYEEFTGFSMERIKWYEAFAYWKNAMIAAQLYKRYLNGKSTDIRMKKFGLVLSVMSKFALNLLNEETA